MIIVACVTSIAHGTDTASMSMFVSPVPVLVPTRAISILSCTQCRCAVVDTRTCSGPERCVLKCSCTLPGVRITCEREVHRGQHSSRGAVQSTWCCIRRTARRLYVPQTEHADGVCPYHVQRCDISDRRFGSEGGATKVFASFLLMECGPVTTV